MATAFKGLIILVFRGKATLWQALSVDVCDILDSGFHWYHSFFPVVAVNSLCFCQALKSPGNNRGLSKYKTKCINEQFFSL